MPDEMTLMYLLVLFVFGACVGSFLNVVIYRLPLDLSLVRPGSACPRCGASIHGYDNIPILSWFLLRGRCRACTAAISFRYPAVEFLNAALWVAVGWTFRDLPYTPAVNAGLMALHLLFVSTLLASTWIDLDHRIIPDEFTLGGLAVALVACVLLPGLHAGAVEASPASPAWMASLFAGLVGMLVGGGVLFLTGVVGTLLLQKQIREAQKHDPEVDSAMGLGDVKLMAMVGAMLGWVDVLLAFLVAVFLGAILGCLHKYRTGTRPDGATGWVAIRERFVSGDSSMPFGPHLCGGALVMLLVGSPIRAWFALQFQPLLSVLGME